MGIIAVPMWKKSMRRFGLPCRWITSTLVFMMARMIVRAVSRNRGCCWRPRRPEHQFAGKVFWLATAGVT